MFLLCHAPTSAVAGMAAQVVHVDRAKLNGGALLLVGKVAQLTTLGRVRREDGPDGLMLSR
eukprot:6109222-Pleurochrysis_carterae.AAC.1